MRIKSGEALASIEINTVKDIGEGDELYNLIVTFFDYKENYLRNLFVKYDAQIKYKKETLSKDNPKLHKWFGTIKESVSKDSISQTSKKSQEKLSDRIVFGNENIDFGKTESGVKHSLRDNAKIGQASIDYNNRHMNVEAAILTTGVEVMHEMAEVMLPYYELFKFNN